MDDRVRIYELAHQMNLPNKDVIDSLRELGYDIKSHSSTVDRQAVGLLIAHLGKKKQQSQQPKATKSASKPAVKPPPPPPPPPPPVVKPRILARHPRREPPPGESPADSGFIAPAAPLDKPYIIESGQHIPGHHAPVHHFHGQPLSGHPAATQPGAALTGPAAQPTPAAPVQPAAAQGAGGQPATGESSVTPTTALPTAATQLSTQPDATVPLHVTSGPAPSSQSAQLKPAPTEAEPVTPPGQAQAEKTEPAGGATAQHAEVPTSSAAAPTIEEKTEKESEAKAKIEEPKLQVLPGKQKEDELDKKKREQEEPNKGTKPLQPMRPMTPSVPTPIRIASPSLRATPPRPPKHRPGGAGERHGQKREERMKPAVEPVKIPREIALTSAVTVKELAEKMLVSETEIIKRLMMKGYMRTINQPVELELARELAVDMGYELQTLENIKIEEALKEEEKKAEIRKAAEDLTDDERAALVPRPPVVTIMGHVDHGKTSLLDAIRQTKFLLTDAEAGGITQHIGAYHVEVKGEDGNLRQVVFLDTPGHEAFTAMRARGAKCTDIAILVVAADDGVMPQTIEAIDHAKAAGVPIVVAVNKIDKAGSDPDKVLNQLMEHGLLPDRFGGETVTVNVSAKKRTGLDELLEMILLVADMQDLKANPEKRATGVIIEAELHRGKGTVATALVQNGTLHIGDIIVAGSVFGRVRNLLDDHGQQVRAAGPSMPVEVLGLGEVPQAGDRFEVYEDFQTAKAVAEKRKQSETDRSEQRLTLESLHELVAQGEVKDLNIIVKADVLGTAEALADQVRKLGTKEVQVRVLRAATGDISENDVNLAASSNAIVIGFNVQPDANAARAADAVGVDIRTYNIIYEIIDNLELAIQGLLQPIKEELQIGTAEVRQVFKFGKNQMIAGCMVVTGKITRGALARIVRGGNQIYEGRIDTLKRFKDDVKEVAQGFECGLCCEKFNDVHEGDLINAFIIHERKR